MTQANRGRNDFTPEVGAATDVARLGHDLPAPRHEWTADEDPDVVDWNRVAASEAFQKLNRAKRRFVIPMTVFFVVYYFALLVLVGWFPGLMETKVWGAVNLAYLFALSQFFVAWGIAGLYLVAAGRFDRMADEINARLEQTPGQPGKGK